MLRKLINKHKEIHITTKDSRILYSTSEFHVFSAANRETKA